MAYETYITDALVCGVKNSYTSDRSYLLFTREVGMIFATARSVREERSRQRYALQEFAHIRVSLIHGKSGWRIGSVEAIHNYYQKAESKEARGSVVSLFRPFQRFLPGEESSPNLHDAILESLECVSKPLTSTERKTIDKVTQVRLLHALGYVSGQSVPEEVLSAPLDEIESVVSQIVDKRLDRALETAVSASHL